MNFIKAIIRRFSPKKKKKIIKIKATNTAKYVEVEVFFDSDDVELRGYFSRTARIGLLSVKLDQLLEHLKNNIDLVFKCRGRINSADEEVFIYFPIPKEVQKTDSCDLISVKKGELMKALVR